MPIDVLGSMPADLPVSSPEKVGLSAERLGRIGPLIDRYIDSQLIPGALTLVARRGRIAHCEVRGFANVEKQIPLRADTIFRIASMTKPWGASTSAVMIRVVEPVRILSRCSHPLNSAMPTS